MHFAIDLLWVKPNNNGGIESYIRNLLDGFSSLPDSNQYLLVCSKDNAYSFEKYLPDNRFSMDILPVSSFSVTKRIVWQNLFLNRYLMSLGIKNCFSPVYCKPLLKTKKIKYITTIHDLQQLHYPEYFSFIQYQWMKFAWQHAINTSDCIVTVSNWVREDIKQNFNSSQTDIRTIYNPIVVDQTEMDFNLLSMKYGINGNDYYFILSSMLKHKNIITILKVIERIVKDDLDLPKRLLIAGISESDENRIKQYIIDHNLHKYCTLLGFVSNEERNTLFIHSFAFLFPSIFEGFGMPVVEALMLGAHVITTKCTSIPEVSQEKAIYVNDPLNVEEWIENLEKVKNLIKRKLIFPQYDKQNIAKQYLELFSRIFEE